MLPFKLKTLFDKAIGAKDTPKDVQLEVESSKRYNLLPFLFIAFFVLLCGSSAGAIVVSLIVVGFKFVGTKVENLYNKFCFLACPGIGMIRYNVPSISLLSLQSLVLYSYKHLLSPTYNLF